MTKTIITSLVLAVIGLVVGAGIGNNRGYTDGYRVGYKAGETYASTAQLQHDNTAYKTVESNNSKLTKQYNQLVTNYNNLRTVALNYVDATQYKTAAPITCTSFSSTTTCY